MEIWGRDCIFVGITCGNPREMEGSLLECACISSYCSMEGEINKKMIDFFKQNIPVAKFFRDGNNFKIKRQSDYLSYPEFLKYFNDLKTITRHNLVIGINFTYGWMPTIFDFRSEKFGEALQILNEAKSGSILTEHDLVLLKGLLNNSLVGTTKLLHFIKPDNFAIWDSRVYRYLTNIEPHDNKIGDCNTYLHYITFCDFLTKQEEFKTLQKSIEEQVGYSMTALRIVELVMYSNGAKK